MKANNNGSYPTSFWFFVTFGAGHVLKLVSLLPSKVMLALLNISDPKGQFILHASCADGRTNERSFSSATLSGGQLIGTAVVLAGICIPLSRSGYSQSQ